MGRPSLYRGDETDRQIYKLCLLGATDSEIADFIGIQESTLNNWKKMYPSFMESLKKGKSVADGNVASKLYIRAIGYEFDETTIEQCPARKTTKHKTTTKHIPASETAAIFWLKNRRPDLWRDRREITGKDGGDLIKTAELDISKFTDEERKILKKIGEMSFNDKE